MIYLNWPIWNATSALASYPNNSLPVLSRSISNLKFFREFKPLASTDLFKIVVTYSHPSPCLFDLEQSHAASPRPSPLLCRPAAGSVHRLGLLPPRTSPRSQVLFRLLEHRPTRLRLVRVGQGKMSYHPCGRLPPHSAALSVNRRRWRQELIARLTMRIL